MIDLHTALDWTFPNYNANPEDSEMLHDMAAAVRKSTAPMWRSASMAMAIAAAWSMTKAKKFLLTKSGLCSRAISAPRTPTQLSSSM